MKVTRTLYFFVGAGLALVLSAFGYFSYHREVLQFKMDMKHDAHILGGSVASAVSRIWKVQGRVPALDLIKDTNAGEPFIHVRWVWIDKIVDEAFKPQLDIRELSPLFQGEEIFAYGKTREGAAAFYTYIPVKIPEVRMGAVELSEPLAKLQEYTRASAARLIFMAFLLIGVGGLFIWVAGHKVIWKRLQKLMNHIHQIGEGDLSTPLELEGNDEISELGQAMNTMSQRLKAANKKIIEETQSRIETLEQLRHTERLSMLGRLSSGVAHELGTPLNVVAGRAKLISDKNLKKEEIFECSRIIREQTERMTKIIRQLLEFAHRRPSRRMPEDIRNLVRQVLNMLSPIAEKQRVTLEFTENGEFPGVLIDRLQIQQVLINLVMNGIQSMPGGGQIKAKLRFRQTISSSQKDNQEKEYLAISIKDEGKGISEENINNIFDPFFTTKEIGKGTGLGLSIAHGIVQEHRGWIDVESTPGKGSCFTIYLPVEENQCMEVS